MAGAGPAGAAGGGKSQNPDVCDGTRDIILHNGRFIDYRGVVASQLTVKDGRIVVVDRGKNLGTCTRRINLRGRTVIPGLIDSHAHFTRTGTNPGYETRWMETVFSIAELQQAVAVDVDRIVLEPFLELACGPVLPRVGARVPAVTVGHRFDQRRAAAFARAFHELHRGPVDLVGVVAVHHDFLEVVGAGAVGRRVCRTASPRVGKAKAGKKISETNTRLNSTSPTG